MLRWKTDNETDILTSVIAVRLAWRRVLNVVL